MERRADYGYDAPYALVAFAAAAAASAAAALVSWRTANLHFARMTAVYGAFFLGNAGSFLYTTRRGKFVVWERILDSLRLDGAERVLDVGCGRGAVLVAVARRLTTGRATGIDLWSTRDQSGNSRDVTMRNAALERVQDRIAIETGDMRALPFADGSFDLVVSSLAIHNLPSKPDRAQAVGEAWRAETGRTPGDSRHQIDRALRPDARGAWCEDSCAARAGMEILVWQSTGRDLPGDGRKTETVTWSR